MFEIAFRTTKMRFSGAYSCSTISWLFWAARLEFRFMRAELLAFRRFIAFLVGSGAPHSLIA